MADIPHAPQPQIHDTPAPERLKRVLEVAKAGYEGAAGTSVVSEELTQREHRRAERERQAYQSHYRDAPEKPR